MLLLTVFCLFSLSTGPSVESRPMFGLLITSKLGWLLLLHEIIRYGLTFTSLASVLNFDTSLHKA